MTEDELVQSYLTPRRLPRRRFYRRFWSVLGGVLPTAFLFALPIAVSVRYSVPFWPFASAAVFGALTGGLMISFGFPVFASARDRHNRIIRAVAFGIFVSTFWTVTRTIAPHVLPSTVSRVCFDIMMGSSLFAGALSVFSTWLYRQAGSTQI